MVGIGTAPRFSNAASRLDLLTGRRAAQRSKAAAGDLVTPEEEIKDPFLLEFLHLKDEYSEQGHGQRIPAGTARRKNARRTIGEDSANAHTPWTEDSLMHWPEWWSWELELTPHLLKRMVDRQFNEVDLRQMLETATGCYGNHEEGRFVIETEHDGRAWAVIVEPSPDDQLLIVVTAYPVE
jgi:hypothetical protein